jgi:hypothetical protein
VDEHHRHVQRLRRENPVDRLLLPERVVAWMLEEFLPEPDLLEAMTPAEFAGRAAWIYMS